MHERIDGIPAAKSLRTSEPAQDAHGSCRLATSSVQRNVTKLKARGNTAFHDHLEGG